MILSDEQEQAMNAIQQWHRTWTPENSGPFVLSGLAGTGKTTLLPLLPSALGVPTRMVAPTWKAAAVLTAKLHAAGLPGQATSIHELIYILKGIKHSQQCAVWIPDHEPDFTRCDQGCAELAFSYFPDKEYVPGVVVVDEASMVDDTVRYDLSRLGRPIIYSGDHGQLPPIRGKSIFVEEPGAGFQLKTIQRQAAESPIIRMAWDIRHGGAAWRKEATWVEKFNLIDEGLGLMDGDTVIIGFMNKTVDKSNAAVRRVLKKVGEIDEGDWLVVRDNDRVRRIYNGQMGRGTASGGLTMQDGKRVSGRLSVVPSNMGDSEWRQGVTRLNYGYALTCHRAQGSEFKRVLIWLDHERGSQSRRWMYTSVTRAVEEVVFRG